MLTFPPLSHAFNNLKRNECRFLGRIFIYASPLAGIFFRQVSLAEFFFGNFHPTSGYF